MCLCLKWTLQIFKLISIVTISKVHEDELFNFPSCCLDQDILDIWLQQSDGERVVAPESSHTSQNEPVGTTTRGAWQKVILKYISVFPDSDIPGYLLSMSFNTQRRNYSTWRRKRTQKGIPQSSSLSFCTIFFLPLYCKHIYLSFIRRPSSQQWINPETLPSSITSVPIFTPFFFIPMQGFIAALLTLAKLNFISINLTKCAFTHFLSSFAVNRTAAGGRRGILNLLLRVPVWSLNTAPQFTARTLLPATFWEIYARDCSGVTEFFSEAETDSCTGFLRRLWFMVRESRGQTQRKTCP